MKILAFLLLIISLKCAILEDAGLNPNDDIKGKEALQILSQAIYEAEALGINYWLSSSGMKGGSGAILPLVLINGILASKLYPYTSTIEPSTYYSRSSVLQCEADIKTKGALYLGLTYDSLPASGIGGPLRDSKILPEFASCNLIKKGSILSIPRVIDL